MEPVGGVQADSATTLVYCRYALTLPFIVTIADADQLCAIVVKEFFGSLLAWDERSPDGHGFSTIELEETCELITKLLERETWRSIIPVRKQRKYLLENVWDYTYSGYDRTIDSHINRLRAKIEANPDEPKMVLTVWGVGYKFNDED